MSREQEDRDGERQRKESSDWCEPLNQLDRSKVARGRPVEPSYDSGRYMTITGSDRIGNVTGWMYASLASRKDHG